MKIKKYGSLFFGLSLFLTGCAGPLYSPFYEKAISGTEYITSVHKDLTSLPPPEKQIPVAVYKFRDQTGQYKYSTTVTSFSTAITQVQQLYLLKL